MKTHERAAPPRGDGRSGGGLDADVQQQVAELNLRGIGVLRAALAAGAAGCESARPAPGPGPGPGAGPGPGPAPAPGAGVRAGRAGRRPERARVAGAAGFPAAIRELGSQWLGLDEGAQLRLAGCPYLLFELDFSAASWAAALPPRSVQEAARDERSGVAAGCAGAAASPFACNDGYAFARLLLHYAWHVVRATPNAAAFVLGAPPTAFEPLRTLGLARVEAIAALAGSLVRLRWDQEPLIWEAWLGAAVRGDPEQLWVSQRRGLQRIAGACREVAYA